ncbi:UxaA family hydrolase [Pararhizobium sp. IMCC21322]|uniref:UxaA family hydrolase n=1 Tax=Pararhizobium sp. IMCC21322 TaxID=3067903 RepID=UPI002741DF32|nr:UxaA family hydrolase [Pararhizobium sp. IMCC21322]
MSGSDKQARALKGMAQDNVAVILSAAKSGDVIQMECHGNSEALTCVTDIPAFHKIATVGINQGEIVIRRGTPIGVATKAIGKGELVHVHNIKSQRAQKTAVL